MLVYNLLKISPLHILRAVLSTNAKWKRIATQQIQQRSCFNAQVIPPDLTGSPSPNTGVDRDLFVFQ